jgi:hypothetical protein
MPNWVFNSVVVSGDSTALNELKEQLNRPVVKNYPDSNYNQETKQWEHTPATQIYSNPVFAFWNVVAPTNLEAYYGEEKKEKSEAFGSDGSFNSNTFMAEFTHSLNTDESWYWWNVRNWGTKWDVAVVDGEKYSNTTLEIVGDESLMYHFETAWSPVHEIFNILSSQYPSLEFDYEYEEEQGWGGHTVWQNGEVVSHEEWDIPSSHADYVDRDREDSCNCAHEDDQEYWFVDCPREEVGV